MPLSRHTARHVCGANGVRSLGTCLDHCQVALSPSATDARSLPVRAVTQRLAAFPDENRADAFGLAERRMRKLRGILLRWEGFTKLINVRAVGHGVTELT